MSSVIYTRIPLPDPILVKEAKKYGVADLHESLGPVNGRMALMSPRMRSLSQGSRICGAAVTGYNYPGDNLMVHVGLRVTERGQILVLTNGGGHQGALCGDITCAYAQKKGVEGIVADGPVRDIDTLRELQFPVWSTFVSPSHPEKRGPGSVNVPVVVDGVLVEPGDVIVADGDGVLVIPREKLKVTIERARIRSEKEVAIRKRIKAGESLFEILKMRDTVVAAGIPERDMTWEQDAE